MKMCGSRGAVLTFIAVISLSIHGSECDSAPSEPVSGDSVIRAKAGDSEIVITTTSRLAGAIGSLTWGGQEFINSTDHGRELQTAWNADAGVNPIQGETFNPTEAGSRDDGAGRVSSSKLLQLHAEGSVLTTVTQPAFWLKPGETSGGHPARNTTVLSDHLLAKRVQIGWRDLSHVIDYRVTVTLPAKERNTYCVIEALTGYMPPEFDHFWTYDAQANRLQAIDHGPGEQPLPLIFSTENGAFAMGVFSTPADAPEGGKGPTYGRFAFEDARVVKWNCVFRVGDPKGLSGNFRYHVMLAVGTLGDVKTTMATLMAELKK